MKILLRVIVISFFTSPLVIGAGGAAAQQVCHMVGKGSPDPNAVLHWTLSTRVNTPCIAAVNPPSNWISTGRHVIVRPKHGKVGFADTAHFAYSPDTGFIGPDRFVIQIDREIFTTREHARRVIDFDVSVTP